MISYERGKDGGPLTIEEDMENFCLYNVGIVGGIWSSDDNSSEINPYYIDFEGN